MSSTQTIVQTQTIDPISGDWTSDLAHNPFDPSLGALTGVKIDIVDTVTGAVTVSGPGMQPTTVSTGIPQVDNATGNLAAHDGQAGFAGGSGTVAGFSLSQTGAAYPADLADFSGAGAVGLSVAGSASFAEVGPGATVSRTATVADATTGWTNTVAVPKFDESLGVPQSVEIALTSDLVASGTLENLAPSAVVADVTAAGKVSIPNANTA